MDSIIPATALSVVSLVNNLLSSARSTKELVKQSTDLELKSQISDLFDAILDVKERVLELGQDNRLLRDQLEQKVSVERDDVTKEFYKKGEVDPLCPTCYQGPKKAVVYLAGQRSGGGWCPVCVAHRKFLVRTLGT